MMGLRRRRLLAACAAMALYCGDARPARAFLGMGDIVFDPSAVAQLVQQVQQGEQQIQQISQVIGVNTQQLKQLMAFYQAMAHVTDVQSFVAELNMLALQQPMVAQAVQLENLFRGFGLTTSVASAVQGILARIQYYQAPSTDFAGQQLNTAATATAGQMASAEAAYDAAQARAQAMKRLQGQIDTSDPAMTAGLSVRAGIEGGIAVSQNTQLLAGLMMQRAQDRAAEEQREQAWRYSADQLATDAQAADAAASSGQVQLVTSGTPASAGAISPATTTAPAISGIGGSDAMSTMLGTSWGQQAADDATTMGVNPQVLALSCVQENNCQPGGTHAGSTISGEFQESQGFYNQYGAEAAAQNPSLASQLVGQSDAGSQAIAAAQGLKDSAQALQAAGISNPTWLDTRGSYQFGAANGVAVATAPDSALMVNVLQGLPASAYPANNITSTTTVGQWRASQTKTVGIQAANAPVLLNSAAS